MNNKSILQGKKKGNRIKKFSMWFQLKNGKTKHTKKDFNLELFKKEIANFYLGRMHEKKETSIMFIHNGTMYKTNLSEKETK